MAASPDTGSTRWVAGLAVGALLLGLLWAYPPFRIVPVKGSPGVATTGSTGSGTFDPAAAAAQIWKTDLPAAAVRAAPAEAVAAAVRADPGAARRTYGRGPSLGQAYFFVRGHGRVVTRDRGFIRVELATPGGPAVVALRIGPVFGNTVRDGCGLVEVNAFPGLTEFNALAAALNARVEQEVQPVLRDRGAIGAEVHFAGCAEAPESAPGADEPVLVIIPVSAEVRP